MTGSVRVLVGTTKGAFILDGNADRTDWQIRGPFCNGGPINHVIGDPASGTIWAAGGNQWTGMGVWRTDDHGANWTMSDKGLTSGDGQEPIAALWSLGRSGAVLYAGVKPASLYESRDRGESWHKVDGLHHHPSFPDWEPGAAGLVLHSIVTDPHDAQKMWVGISAADGDRNG